jgi:hypothetical protein
MSLLWTEQLGRIAPAIAASRFGPNAISLAGFVMGRFRLSKRQATDLLAECFALPMAVSTVVNQQQCGQSFGDFG